MKRIRPKKRVFAETLRTPFFRGISLSLSNYLYIPSLAGGEKPLYKPPTNRTNPLAFWEDFVYTVCDCGLKWYKVVRISRRRRSFRRSAVNIEIEHMFLGQYRHTLDEKGRLTIPARFREDLSGGAYLTQGFDCNLRVLTETAFEAIYGKLSQMNTTDPTARELRRLILATASQVDLDRVGRILIPQFLRDVASLESDAVIVGVGEAVEIWSPGAWEGQITRLSDVDANSQRFAELDL